MRQMAASAALLVLAACGGKATEAQSGEPGRGSEDTATTAQYTDPREMVAEAQQSVDFLQSCEKRPSYSIYGDLHVSCIGRNHETIYFSTFQDPAVGEALSKPAFPGQKAYVGNGWAVSTYSDQSLDDLVTALS